MRYPIAGLTALALLAAVPVSTPALAKPAPEVNVEADGLAVGGYDVTAYFLQGRALRGNADYRFNYKGVTWHFASAESLAKFKADPAAFEPQFGGYCAWAVSQGYIAPGDPEQWKIVDGKLYLNFNARAKELWEADQEDAIRRGHANWPGVLSKNQDSE